MSRLSHAFLFGLFLCLLAPSLHAQWTSNTALNTPVVTDQRNQRYPTMVSDGSGGMIIVWEDERYVKGSYDIFAQRLDANGIPLWTLNGVPVTTANAMQNRPMAISDQQGGAIIIWKDNRYGNNDIFGQRIGPDGNVKWASNGIPIYSGDLDQSQYGIVPDGTGGAIISWIHQSQGASDGHVIVQRIDGNGNAVWQGAGTVVCGADVYQAAPVITSDGHGGAFLAWQDYRSADNNIDIYAQHIDASGNSYWTQDGVPVAASPGSQQQPAICSDGGTGAYVSWSDYASGTQPKVSIAHLDGSGSVTWSKAVTSTSNQQDLSVLLPSGSTNVIAVWQDRRSGSDDIYAQKYDVTGSALWGTNGFAVCNAANGQVAPKAYPDGSDGAIIVWEDQRSSFINADIYAQRVNPAGSAMWAANGQVISNAANYQTNPTALPDGAGGASFAWEDYRVDVSNAQIYAQKIAADGTFPKAGPVTQFSSKILDFGKVAKGGTKPLTFTITNAGDLELVLQPTTSSQPVFAGRTTSASVAGKGQKTDTVKFTPNAIGAVNGYILVPSNTTGKPDTVQVKGVGIGSPVVQLLVTDLSFGPVKVGMRKDLPFSLTNTGDDTLRISSITSTHADVSIRTTAAVVPPGVTFKDSATYNPKSVGSARGVLRILSNTASGKDSITWNGLGAGTPVLLATPLSVTFGSVEVTKYVDTLVTFNNTGNDTLRVTSIDSDSPSFTVTPTSLNVPPSDSRTITIRFAPLAVGMPGGVISVYSNDEQSPLSINVLGTAVDLNDVEGAPVVAGTAMLYPNYPNPFNPGTVLTYHLAVPGDVVMRVFDVRGTLVETLVDGMQSAGMHTVSWQPASGLPSGVYTVRLQHCGNVLHTRVMLAK